MKQRFLTVLTVFGCSLIFAGCMHIDSTPSSPSAPAKAVNAAPAQSLHGLSVQQVLQAKYDQAILRCDLEFQTTSNGSPETGTDNTSWDLLKNYADHQDITLEAKSDNVLLTAKLSISQIEIAEKVLLKDPQTQIQYQMEYTPTLSGTWSYSASAPITFGSTTYQAGGQGKLSLNERIESDVVDVSESTPNHEDDGSGSYSVHSKCILDAVLKPEFASQFQVIHLSSKSI